MDKSLHYNQQEEPEQCKSEVEEVYVPKPEKWLSVFENTVIIL